jgi:hypothetical protein
MADDEAQQPEENAQEAQQQGRQRTTLRVRDWESKTSYANVCMLSSTAEEMVLNFGMSFPTPQQREQQQAEVLVTNRVIMGLPGAKRLAIALSQAIQRYENTFGVIDAQQRPPGTQAPGTEQAAGPPSPAQ